MPFTVADVEKHTKKATTDKLKRQWVKVANSWRANCLKQNGSEKKCDASAIKTANGVIARQVEEAMPLMEIGQIAKSAIEVGLAVANGSNEITPGRATKVLRTWEAELGELWQPGMAVVESASFQVNGHTVSLEELKAAYLQLNESEEAELAEFVGSPRNPYGTHASKGYPGGRGSWKKAWRVHISGASSGPIRGTVRRTGMIAATMKCNIPAMTAEGVGARSGPDKLTGSFKEKPSDYGLSKWKTPSEGNLEQEDIQFTCQDLEDIRRICLQEIAKRQQKKKQKEAAVGTEEMVEAAGSLRDTVRRVEDSFHAAFSPKDRWEGPYRDRDVFMGHPTLGDSVIIDHREEGVTYAVPFVIGEDGIEFSPRGEWKQVELAYVPMQQAEAEVESDGMAVELADATEEDTATLSEAETAIIEAGRRAPVVVDFQILKPGPGNKKDNHYYPVDVVKRDIHVFSGVDVFATDHKESERSELTKVGKVLDCPARFTEDDAPVAPVLIYDPDQAEKARNRADAGALDTLECSIFGDGQAKKGKVDGKKYKIVESLTRGRYLELVSKAGAGGKALNLAEADLGGKNMDKEKKEADATPVEEVEIEEAEGGVGVAEQVQEQELQALGEEVVKKALDATNLPEFVKAALSERQYQSDDELKEAVSKATAEVKKLTGSGAVTDLGESESAEEEPSFEEREQRRKDKFNEIMRDIQLKEV